MTAVSTGAPKKKRRRSLYSSSALALRWLHIYLSMVSLAALCFFAFTGLTLNHPTWLGAAEVSVRDEEGQLSTARVGESLDRLEIAEELRSNHALRGRVTEFEVDEFECMIVYQGPGYAADVFIDRETGAYTVTESASGWMAILNDLHKGRDSGAAWAWVIDVSAVATILVSVTGFALLLYIRRRRRTGLLSALAGTIVLVVAWALWVP